MSTPGLDERIHPMFRIQNQSATPRADRSRSTRRLRRSTAPTLSTLEDRRLMTAGVATTAIEPAVALAAPVAATKMMATEPASLSIAAGDTGPTDFWIYSGSDAQFGPTGSYVLYGGNAWPTPASASSPDASPDQVKLDAAFAKQWTDIQSVQDKSEVTPKLLAALRNARSAVGAQAGQPDAALLKAFQDDAQKVQESGTFTDAQQKQLKDEYTAVLKSAGVSDDAINALYAAQDAVKAASHVTPDDVALLAADQKAVQALVDAMPHHDAIAYAGAADAFKGGAGGAPLSTLSSAAVNLSSAPAVAPASNATTLAGAPVDPAVDPATLAATTSGPVTTTEAPVTTISAPVTTTSAPTTVPAFDARAAAMGTLPAGARLPNSGLVPLSQSTGVNVPVYRPTTSDVTPLAGAMRRLSARTLNNTNRRNVPVNALTPGTNAVPAIRQRPNFIGTMRRGKI